MTREAESRLKAAHWLVRPETQRLMGLLDGAEGRTRAVGGTVRDTIMDRLRAGAEVDLATELLPDEVMKRAQSQGLGAHPTGIEHGTVTLISGSLTAEVTTLREDVETYGRRARVRFGTDWHRDAERRDFTMNALYAGMDGSLFDPIHGLADCLAGRVRFIGDARRRIAEDHLRVFRFFRFSASHGNGARGDFDAVGLAACRAAAGELQGVTAERIGHEMVRILSLEVCAPVIAAMVDAGVLSIAAERVAKLAACEQLAGRCLLAGRLALIGGNASGVAALKQGWRLSNDMERGALRVLELAHLLAEGDVVMALVLHGSAAIDDLNAAAALAGRDAQWIAATRTEMTRLEDLRAGRTFPLSGKDLIKSGIPAGPDVGQELQRLQRLWIESEFTLDRNQLLSRITG